MIYKLSQRLTYFCAVVFLIVSYHQRSTLDLSEGESFTSLLLIFCVTLLLICLGTLSGLVAHSSE